MVNAVYSAERLLTMEVINKAQRSQDDKELVKKLRDDVLKDFLDERYLREYLASYYKVHELSNVKIEFMKKDFREVMAAPLEESRYETIVAQLDNPDKEERQDDHGHQLFFEEIEKVVMRYLF